MAKHYKQGKFKPSNTDKYVGNLNEIVYRSSWEYHFFKHCDLNENVLKWNSEGLVIPYVSPVDNKIHRYFVDIVVTYKQKDGGSKTFLVEIKPYEQTKPPKEPKRKTKKAMNNYKNAVKTYAVNQAKWKAARDFAAKHGYEFVVITENELFKK